MATNGGSLYEIYEGDEVLSGYYVWSKQKRGTLQSWVKMNTWYLIHSHAIAMLGTFPCWYGQNQVGAENKTRYIGVTLPWDSFASKM